MDLNLLDLDASSILRETEAGPSSPLGLGPRDAAADSFFRSDARRLGVSLAEYERTFDLGVYQGPRESRIEYSEVPAGLTDEDFSAAALRETIVIEERLHKQRHGYKRRATRSCASDLSAIRSGPKTPARSSGPRTPRRANRARTCVRPSSRGGSLIAA